MTESYPQSSVLEVKGCIVDRDQNTEGNWKCVEFLQQAGRQGQLVFQASQRLVGLSELATMSV